MKPARPKKRPVIVLWIKRTAIFFFSLSVLTAFLYVIGTAQEFMDRTQLLLLRLSIILGLCLAMDSLCGVVLNFWFLFQRRKIRFLGSLGFYFVTGAFGAAMSTAAAFIIVTSGGNGS
jgi:hypothetical protein